MLSLSEPIHELAWYFAARDYDAAVSCLLDARPGTHARAEAYLALRRASDTWDITEAAYARFKIAIDESSERTTRKTPRPQPRGMKSI
jgi:hypothetical protein